MSKIFAIVATAALLTSATAFAQKSAPASDSSAPAASAPADASAPSDTAKAPKMHKHHMAKGMRSAKNGGTDHDADKLNACMSNATPTDQQEQCLKQASS
jgi:hypothetical protein